MLNFKTVSRALRDFSVNYKPLDKMEMFEDDFRFLRRADISVISGNRDINEYIRNINQEIIKRIDRMQKYFPEWVKFKNVKSLFMMPANIEDESKKFQVNQAAYPHQRYIYWREPEPCGYILCTDKSILEIAYYNNWEYFQDHNKVVDASKATKNNIYDFLQRGKKIQIFVDGENADCYLDSFKTMEDNAFFKGVFRAELKKVIDEELKFGSARKLFSEVMKRSRAEISPAEKEQMFDKYIKGLKLKVTADGDFEIVIPD